MKINFKLLLKRTIFSFENALPRQRRPMPLRILILGYMGIGNMILFLPTIRSLKKKFPSSNITLITDTKRKCEELIKETKYIDDIKYFDYEEANFLNKIKYLYSLWSNNYDTLLSNINFPGGSFWILAGLTIPRRIGPVSKYFANNYLYFTDKVIIDPLQHEINMNLELLNVFGINPEETSSALEIAINGGEEEAEDFLQSSPLHDKKTIIAICPGISANQQWKQWPMERMAEVARRLIAGKDIGVAVLGSPTEQQSIESVFGRSNKRLINVAGKLSLKGTAALIKKSRLILGNDSGLLHVAAAMGTPIIMIAGPTNIARSKPVSPSMRILTKSLECQPCYFYDGTIASLCRHRKCLMEITTYDVLKEVLKMIPDL